MTLNDIIRQSILDWTLCLEDLCPGFIEHGHAKVINDFVNVLLDDAYILGQNNPIISYSEN